MKIAIFYNLNFGGAKRVVFDQVKYLRKNNHTVDVYTTDMLHDSFDMETVANATYRYPFTISSFSLPVINQIVEDYSLAISLKKVHKKIAHDIDSKKYDIVIAHPDKLTQSPYILRFLKTKNAYYCQEPLRIVYEYGMRFQNSPSVFHTLYETLRRHVRKTIDIVNVRAAYATIASCYHIRERMIEAYDVTPHVVYAGIDIHTFAPQPVEKEKKVFFVGSKYEPADGYALAKKAVDLIPVSIRPELVVVSWKKDNGERLTDTELAAIYTSSSATLCLSRFETFGLVPLESMACGTAVIATTVSGHRETMVKEAGFLVEYDPKEVKEKIIFLLDKKNAQIYGKHARAYSEKKWRWEIRIKELEKTIKEITTS